MNKKVLAIVLALVMCLTLLPVTAVAAPQETVEYVELKWDEGSKTVKPVTPAPVTTEYSVVTDSGSGATWAGTCVVQGNVNITGDITLNGDVNLILCDGANLNVNGQIIGGDYSLTIYGQMDDSGNLNVYKTVTELSVNAVAVKDLTICGGNVSADAVSEGKFPKEADGFSVSGDLTIYGGTVRGYGAGGNTDSGIYVEGDLNIYGGYVAGFGSGSSVTGIATEKSMTVYGGEVTANANGASGYGIFAGVDLAINGGSVSASLTANIEESNAAILSMNNITVNGGSVAAYATGPKDVQGMFAMNDVSISGGSVAASANSTDGGNATGIMAYINDISVTGGSVAAYGTTAAMNNAPKTDDSGTAPTLVKSGAEVGNFDDFSTATPTSLAIQYRQRIPEAPYNTYVERSWNEAEQKVDETSPEIPTGAKVATSSDVDVVWDSGTYVVTGDTVILGDIVITADTELILMDGATLTVMGAINDPIGRYDNGDVSFGEDSCSLSIYGQAEDSGLLHALYEEESRGAILLTHELMISGGRVVVSANNDNLQTGDDVTGFAIELVGDGNDHSESGDGDSSYGRFLVLGGRVTASGNCPYADAIGIRSSCLEVHDGKILAVANSNQSTGIQGGDPNITIEGIRVTGGAVTGIAKSTGIVYEENYYINAAAGISAGSNMRVSGGTVTGIAGNAKGKDAETANDYTNGMGSVFGISVSGKLTAENRSRVTGIGNAEIGNECDGIYSVNSGMSKGMEVTDSLVTGIACGNDVLLCSGISSWGAMKVMEGSTVIANAKNRQGEGNGIYLYYAGGYDEGVGDFVCIPAELKVSGGSVIADGSSEKALGCGIDLYGVGVEEGEPSTSIWYSDSVTVSGGSVTATGNSAEDQGYGIYAEKPDPEIYEGIKVNPAELSVTDGELAVAGSKQALSERVSPKVTDTVMATGTDVPDGVSIKTNKWMDGKNAADWDNSFALNSDAWKYVEITAGDDDEGGCGLLRLIRAALVTKLTVCSLVCETLGFVRLTARIAAAENATIGAATRAMWAAAHMAWLANAWHLWH